MQGTLVPGAFLGSGNPPPPPPPPSGSPTCSQLTTLSSDYDASQCGTGNLNDQCTVACVADSSLTADFVCTQTSSSTAEWQGTAPDCTRPPPPPEGNTCDAISVDTTRYSPSGCDAGAADGTTCTVSCAAPYVLVGAAVEYTCVDDGTTANWQGSRLPTCRLPPKCPNTPGSNFAACTPNTVGSVCTPSCARGYQLLLGKRGTFTCTLNAQGTKATWVSSGVSPPGSPPPPTCVANNQVPASRCLRVLFSRSLVAWQVSEGE